LFTLATLTEYDDHGKYIERNIAGIIMRNIMLNFANVNSFLKVVIFNSVCASSGKILIEKYMNSHRFL
jgi:hypothetical protein